ncbi:MAG: carbohydrate ABC transporter permease [Actinomycetota bacterium]|jgi:multiple sugar transport system permease protein/sn-glycerol 3-phosphate transport system permease protein|nr:carbohydrate ABC transporter permease [Actinomycetota bacterium]
MATAISTRNGRVRGAPAALSRPRRGRRERMIVVVARHVVLIIATILFFGPFVWMILTSLKSSSSALVYPPTLLPHRWHFGNYLDVFRAAPFGTFYLNSIIQAVASTIGQVVTSALAGYAFARLRFPGRQLIFVILLGALLVPFQVVFVPLVHLLAALHWLNTYQGLIIPNIPSIFGAFLFRQFFTSFPAELEDAAAVDGAGILRRFISVVAPLSRGTAGAFAILAFIYNWNNFFYQFIIVSTNRYMTVQLGLVLFQSQQTASEFNLLMAASTIAVIPVLIVFLIFQRQIVRGIMLGGLK